MYLLQFGGVCLQVAAGDAFINGGDVNVGGIDAQQRIAGSALARGGCVLYLRHDVSVRTFKTVGRLRANLRIVARPNGRRVRRLAAYCEVRSRPSSDRLRRVPVLSTRRVRGP